MKSASSMLLFDDGPLSEPLQRYYFGEPEHEGSDSVRGFDRGPHCRNDNNTGYGASQNRCFGDRSKVLDEHGAAAADSVRRTAAPFLFLGMKGYWTKLAFRREMRLVRDRPITAATP